MNFPFSYFFYIFALVIYLVVTISLDAFKESPHLINNVYHTFACFADGGRITTATIALVGLGLEYLGKVKWNGKLSPCCRERFWRRNIFWEGELSEKRRHFWRWKIFGSRRSKTSPVNENNWESGLRWNRRIEDKERDGKRRNQPSNKSI